MRILFEIQQDFIVFDQFLDTNNELEANICTKNRSNKDLILDSYGKRLIQLCKNTNMLIGN